ncbi:rhodanese-like domain-containing protein [Halobacillus sp. ACCC02827]|uniref:rhodanese-like domain-containing protein n=1 Tax=Bacillaceae TaxID=186817 RepID=UPI00041F49F1|nr:MULTISPECIES: rhodanese-like domain-containing protein [Bacillaceae]QHT47470.1 rhodanese-like domain-containing protein [Bacillus sp. SB49]WJE14696.1 rhodanese-like domain-containing protein [Halobacillus sp. ACCC02827]
MTILYGFVLFLLLWYGYQVYKRSIVKPYREHGDPELEFCIIDIRDYISAYRSPYPGAENIPLSYLPRVLKDRFDCQDDILVVTDDKRAAKLAAKMIRKNKNTDVYYVNSKERSTF